MANDTDALNDLTDIMEDLKQTFIALKNITDEIDAGDYGNEAKELCIHLAAKDILKTNGY